MTSKVANPKVFDGGLAWPTTSPVWIGIDQSYTGFAVTAINADGAYYTWVYKAPDTGIDRLVCIQEWLNDLLLEIGTNWIQDVAIEAPVRMSHSALISGELFCAARLTLRSALGGSPGQYPLQVPPATLKKYVTGKGTGVQKNQMLLETYKKWGVSFTDDNAADSYGLARIASKSADLAYEKQVLKTLGDPKFRDKTLTS